MANNLYPVTFDAAHDRSDFPCFLSVPVSLTGCSHECEHLTVGTPPKKPNGALSLATYSKVYLSSRKGHEI